MCAGCSYSALPQNWEALQLRPAMQLRPPAASFGVPGPRGAPAAVCSQPRGFSPCHPNLVYWAAAVLPSAGTPRGCL